MDQKEAQRLFDYDPETGALRWRIARGGGAVVGAEAGYINAKGYRAVNVNRRMQYAHRLIWLWMTGAWPVKMIDHCNCVRSDNRWANLRSAEPSENLANAKRPRHNTSGAKGAHLYKRTGRHSAQITKYGRKYHLGYFNTTEEAAAAYAKAAKDLFGAFARRG